MTEDRNNIPFSYLIRDFRGGAARSEDHYQRVNSEIPFFIENIENFDTTSDGKLLSIPPLLKNPHTFDVSPSYWELVKFFKTTVNGLPVEIIIFAESVDVAKARFANRPAQWVGVKNRLIRIYSRGIVGNSKFYLMTNGVRPEPLQLFNQNINTQEVFDNEGLLIPRDLIPTESFNALDLTLTNFNLTPHQDGVDGVPVFITSWQTIKVNPLDNEFDYLRIRKPLNLNLDEWRASLTAYGGQYFRIEPFAKNNIATNFIVGDDWSIRDIAWESVSDGIIIYTNPSVKIYKLSKSKVLDSTQSSPLFTSGSWVCDTIQALGCEFPLERNHFATESSGYKFPFFLTTSESTDEPNDTFYDLESQDFITNVQSLTGSKIAFFDNYLYVATEQQIYKINNVKNLAPSDIKKLKWELVYEVENEDRKIKFFKEGDKGLHFSVQETKPQGGSLDFLYTIMLNDKLVIDSMGQFSGTEITGMDGDYASFYNKTTNETVIGVFDPYKKMFVRAKCYYNQEADVQALPGKAFFQCRGLDWSSNEERFFYAAYSGYAGFYEIKSADNYIWNNSFSQQIRQAFNDNYICSIENFVGFACEKQLEGFVKPNVGNGYYKLAVTLKNKIEIFQAFQNGSALEIINLNVDETPIDKALIFVERSQSLDNEYIIHIATTKRVFVKYYKEGVNSLIPQTLSEEVFVNHFNSSEVLIAINYPSIYYQPTLYNENTFYYIDSLKISYHHLSDENKNLPNLPDRRRFVFGITAVLDGEQETEYLYYRHLDFKGKNSNPINFKVFFPVNLRSVMRFKIYAASFIDDTNELPSIEFYGGLLNYVGDVVIKKPSIGLYAPAESATNTPVLFDSLKFDDSDKIPTEVTFTISPKDIFPTDSFWKSQKVPILPKKANGLYSAFVPRPPRLLETAIYDHTVQAEVSTQIGARIFLVGVPDYQNGYIQQNRVIYSDVSVTPTSSLLAYNSVLKSGTISFDYRRGKLIAISRNHDFFIFIFEHSSVGGTIEDVTFREQIDLENYGSEFPRSVKRSIIGVIWANREGVWHYDPILATKRLIGNLSERSRAMVKSILSMATFVEATTTKDAYYLNVNYTRDDMPRRVMKFSFNGDMSFLNFAELGPISCIASFDNEMLFATDSFIISTNYKQEQFPQLYDAQIMNYQFKDKMNLYFFTTRAISTNELFERERKDAILFKAEMEYIGKIDLHKPFAFLIPDDSVAFNNDAVYNSFISRSYRTKFFVKLVDIEGVHILYIDDSQFFTVGDLAIGAEKTLSFNLFDKINVKRYSDTLYKVSFKNHTHTRMIEVGQSYSLYADIPVFNDLPFVVLEAFESPTRNGGRIEFNFKPIRASAFKLGFGFIKRQADTADRILNQRVSIVSLRINGVLTNPILNRKIR